MTRVLRVLLCTVFVLGNLLATPVHADDAVVRPERVGFLSRFPSDIAGKYHLAHFKDQVAADGPQGSIISDPQRGKLYQIWTLGDQSPLKNQTIVAERDFGTLKLLRSMIIPRLVIRANSPIGAEWVHTLDSKNHRLFLEVGHYSVAETAAFSFAVLDLATFAVRIKDVPRAVLRNFEKVQAVFGLEYDEERDELVVIAAGIDNNPSSTLNSLTIVGWKSAEFSTDGPLPGLPQMLGPRYIRNCRRDPINFVSSPGLTPIMIAKGPDLSSTVVPPPVKTWVVFPCYTTPYSVNVALIRIDRAVLFHPTSTDEKAIPAPSAIAHWVMDTVRGRLFLLNATQEVDAWVYEVASDAFIGIIEMTPKGDTNAASVGLGVDEASGRLYGLGFGFGIMISEADQDPVPQVDTYEAGTPKLPGQATIHIDPVRNQILFVRGAGGPGQWEDQYELWRVPPPLPPQAIEDPDGLTSQVAEAPGKSTAEFGGIASAYGARILLAGGIAGIPPSNGNDTAGSVYANANARCGFRDREIVLGLVTKTELSQSIVDARAESVRLDDNSIKDFGQPSRCDAYYTYAGPAPQIFPQVLRDNLFFASLLVKSESLRRATGLDAQLKTLGVGAAVKQLTGVNIDRDLEAHVNDQTAPRTRWDYEPAFCAADWYPGDKPGQNSERLAGATKVDCRTPNTVSADSEGHLTALLGTQGASLPLKIGRAVSYTKVTHDPALGTVSEAVARVENLQIGGVTIGFIENRARSYAHGRTGTAKTDTYEPVIGLVRNGTSTICPGKCSIDDVLPALNAALSGRAELRRAKPDVTLAKGTKGGYEAGIIKSDKKQASDNALTGDSSRQVPALEIIIYNDNPVLGRARQLVQLAAVRVTSNYAIKAIQDGTPCTDCDPPTPTPDPPQPPSIVGGTKTIVVEKPVPGPTIVQRVPVIIGSPGGYRLFVASPRIAGAMLTVWLLFVAPAMLYMRRKRLKTLL